MTASNITVRAPSRLHFGLLSFNNPDVRQFGGIGLMLEQPFTELRFEPAPQFGCTGEHANRVMEFAETWRVHHRLESLPNYHVHVAAAAPQHVGLGLGTQLGLATAAGLSRCQFNKALAATDLATSVGRGRRSAIGTHGFQRGGFLYELGKSEAQNVSPLERRLEFPSRWSVILIQPRGADGLSGESEQLAFNELDAVPESTTQTLIREITDTMIPAIEAADFASFSTSVTRYGETAGRCFEACQGGPYANETLQTIVDTLRNIGIKGVGQSSWGPTIFAFAECSESAADFIEAFRRAMPQLDANIRVCEANNRGAQIAVSEP